MFIVNIFSEKKHEIEKFLKLYFNKDIKIKNKTYWQKEYDNPLDMIDILSCFADNEDNFEIAFWISLDKNIFININKYTANDIIKYLLERFPN